MKKVLFFEGAGMDGEEFGDINNCRIRTAFRNLDGKAIYLELMSGCEYEKKLITKGKHKGESKYVKLPDDYMIVDFCHYITEDDVVDDCNNSRLDCERKRHHVLWKKADVLQFINSELHCDFDDLIALPWLSGYYVHSDCKKPQTSLDRYNLMEDYAPKYDPALIKARRKVYYETAKEYYAEIYKRHATPRTAYLMGSALTYGAHSLVEIGDDYMILRSHTYAELIDDDERVHKFPVVIEEREVC